MDDHGTVSFFTAQGPRTYQEDRYVVFRNDRGNEISHGNGWLLAVIDGHNGSEAASCAALHLPRVFQYSLRRSSGDILEALRKAFELLVLETETTESGAVLSVVYIPDMSCTAFVAVLGDAPVVIWGAGGKIWVSPNHNVGISEDERDAAIARGGAYAYGYIWTPNGYKGLQVGRSLGDCFMGDILSRDPDIAAVPLGADSFVLLGTDGLFSAESEEEETVGRLIAMVRAGADTETLVSDALQRRRVFDNVTSILYRSAVA